MIKHRFLLLLLVVVAATFDLMSCPSCSDNFTKGSANAGVGEAYSWSVLFMLVVPMTIVSTFGFLLWRKMRVVHRA